MSNIHAISILSVILLLFVVVYYMLVRKTVKTNKQKKDTSYPLSQTTVFTNSEKTSATSNLQKNQNSFGVNASSRSSSQKPSIAKDTSEDLVTASAVELLFDEPKSHTAPPSHSSDHRGGSSSPSSDYHSESSSSHSSGSSSSHSGNHSSDSSSGSSGGDSSSGDSGGGGD